MAEHRPSRRTADVFRSSRSACSSTEIIHQAVALGDPDALENARTASAVNPAARKPASVGMRGSSQPLTMAVAHQLRQHALGTPCRKIEPRELDRCGRDGDRQRLDEPVVQRPVVLELQRADRVRDACSSESSSPWAQSYIG